MLPISLCLSFFLSPSVSSPFPLLPPSPPPTSLLSLLICLYLFPFLFPSLLSSFPSPLLSSHLPPPPFLLFLPPSILPPLLSSIYLSILSVYPSSFFSSFYPFFSLFLLVSNSSPFFPSYEGRGGRGERRGGEGKRRREGREKGEEGERRGRGEEEREEGRKGGKPCTYPSNSFIQFFIQAEDVKALLSDAMLHSNKTTSSVAAKPAQKNSKQASEVTPLSTANSRLLASDLTGAGDGASTERPVMELPPGKTTSKQSTQTFSRQNYQKIRHRPPALRQWKLVVQWLANVPFTSVTQVRFLLNAVIRLKSHLGRM